LRGLRFSIFLWFVTIVAILCLKLPTVEVEKPSPVVEVVEVVTPEPEPEVAPQPWTDEEVIVLAKMLWGEARGVSSDAEKAACVWCALNRVDHGYGDIITAVTTPKQFVGYNEENPVDDGLITLCIDVLTRWYAEREGQVEVGRVLPADYLWFSGDGERNHFRNAYRGGDRWDWSLQSPYES
jgi:hypothetical protein